MFHISIKRQKIRLSNDINNIRMDKRILLEIKKLIFFFLKSLASATSLNNLFQPLTLYTHGVKVQMEGTKSQIFFKCPSFCFMKSRRNVKKIH